jgi:hypothetical protein
LASRNKLPVLTPLPNTYFGAHWSFADGEHPFGADPFDAQNRFANKRFEAWQFSVCRTLLEIATPQGINENQGTGTTIEQCCSFLIRPPAFDWKLDRSARFAGHRRMSKQ